MDVDIIISKDPLDYFKNLFDKVIDNDSESEELFKILVLKNGTTIVYTLTKLLNYEVSKKKQLFDKAFRICAMSLFDKTHNTDPVEVAFGCRSYESHGEGYWDGAFVIIKSKDDVFKAFTFEYKKDTISELDNLELAIDLYNKYINEKWIPMTIDDIKKTTGVEIDNSTLVNINKIKNKIKRIDKNKNNNIIAVSLGIGTFLAINLVRKLIPVRK